MNIDNLNKEQKEAVINTEGPMLVLAGAGSGKTKVLTTKIAYLIKEKKVDPSSILAITSLYAAGIVIFVKSAMFLLLNQFLYS